MQLAQDEVYYSRNMQRHRWSLRAADMRSLILRCAPGVQSAAHAVSASTACGEVKAALCKKQMTHHRSQACCPARTRAESSPYRCIAAGCHREAPIDASLQCTTGVVLSVTSTSARILLVRCVPGWGHDRGDEPVDLRLTHTCFVYDVDLSVDGSAIAARIGFHQRCHRFCCASHPEDLPAIHSCECGQNWLSTMGPRSSPALL
jgi:hypothetical protein